MFVSATRDAIAELHRVGLSQPEIARQLDLAPTTVSYHVDRILRPAAHAPNELPPSAVSESKTRDRVRSLLAEGLSHVEVVRRLGVSKATISYHARRIGAAIDERCSRRYNWEAVQRYYDEGHSVRECMQAFGFSSSSWSLGVKRDDIVARPNATPTVIDLTTGWQISSSFARTVTARRTPTLVATATAGQPHKRPPPSPPLHLRQIRRQIGQLVDAIADLLVRGNQPPGMLEVV
jgi:DNA-binding CsgD family transcriptional regulator